MRENNGPPKTLVVQRAIFVFLFSTCTLSLITANKLDELLDLVRDTGSWNPILGSAAEYVAAMQSEVTGAGFENRDLSKDFGRHEGDIVLSVHKDPLGVIRKLFAHPKGGEGLVVRPEARVDKHGQRVYSTMSTSDKWLQDQVGLYYVFAYFDMFQIESDMSVWLFTCAGGMGKG